MPTTPINAFRYPASNAAPNVAADFQNLASDVEGRLPKILANQGTIAGTAPTADKPWIVKAYSVVVATNAGGDASHSFPGGAFPNGVATLIVASGDVAGNQATVTINSPATTSAVGTRHYQPNGTVVASSSVRINVIAVGW